MSLLSAGIESLKAGDWSGAVASLSKAELAGEDGWASAHNLGIALARVDRLEEARAAFERAVDAAPQAAGSWAALGLLHAKLGALFASEASLRTSLELEVNVDVVANLGAVLREQGRPAAAAEILYPALKAAEVHATGWNTLGVALQDLGDLPTAAGCFHRAAQQDPSDPVPLVNLHGALFDDGNLAVSRRCLEAAAQLAPTDPATRFHLGCVWGLEVAEAANRHHAVLPPQVISWRDSWQFVLAARDEHTRFFGSTAAGLRFAVSLAKLDGLVVELGVRFGTTLRLLQQSCDQTVHGFDTFEGLPESWHERPAGAYSTGGHIPDLGPDCHLHVGLFSETVGPFVDRQSGPLRLVHVDCDLYSATAVALRALAPRVAVGTVLVFDEYLMNPRWREDEHRALVEVGEEQGWTWRYAAFGLLSHQAVVVITGV